MMRHSAIFAVALVSGCAEPVTPPTDLCDFPDVISSWEGANVKFEGILVGASPHPYGFMANNCVRGLQLFNLHEQAHNISFKQRFPADEGKPGIMHVVISGKLAAFDQTQSLFVTKVEDYRFEPMSYEQLDAFWEKKLQQKRHEYD